MKPSSNFRIFQKRATLFTYNFSIYYDSREILISNELLYPRGSYTLHNVFLNLYNLIKWWKKLIFSMLIYNVGPICSIRSRPWIMSVRDFLTFVIHHLWTVPLTLFHLFACNIPYSTVNFLVKQRIIIVIKSQALILHYYLIFHFHECSKNLH